MRAGGLTLGRAAQYLCPGVVLAVVDPGVGTERRAIAVEVGGGQSYLVGPDNGLLAGAVAMGGGATAAVELTNPDYQLAAPGPTFAGRDVFAPAAAHLCAGVPLADLGPPDRPAVAAARAAARSPARRTAPLVAEVLWVDRYGNCQLNVDPDEVAAFGPRVQLRWGDDVRTAERAPTYEGIAPGQVGLVVDSYGMLSVCLGKRSAADGAAPCRSAPRSPSSAPSDDDAAAPVDARHPHHQERPHEARHHPRPRHPPRASSSAPPRSSSSSCSEVLVGRLRRPPRS